MCVSVSEVMQCEFRSRQRETHCSRPVDCIANRLIVTNTNEMNNNME